jgi:hypothetical protein
MSAAIEVLVFEPTVKARGKTTLSFAGSMLGEMGLR